MVLISSRRHEIIVKAAELVEASETRFGRSPNNLERDRLSRQATLVTRKAKTHDGETCEKLFDRVDGQLRAEVSGGLVGVVHGVLDARDHAPQPQQ